MTQNKIILIVIGIAIGYYLWMQSKKKTTGGIEINIPLQQRADPQGSQTPKLSSILMPTNPGLGLPAQHFVKDIEKTISTPTFRLEA